MLSTSPRAARVRLAIAFAVVIALGAGAWALTSIGGGGALDPRERALIEAVQKKTGLQLSLQKSELDVGAGTWRGLDVELRGRGVEGPLGRPLVSASVVDLKLDSAALVRGEIRIEHALLHDAVLFVDRRSNREPSSASARDLIAVLPAVIEAPRATVVLDTDAGYATLAGLSAVLRREGSALRGSLDGLEATLLLQEHLKNGQPPGPQTPAELRVKAGVAWQAEGLTLSALELKLGQSVFRGDARLASGDTALKLRSDAAQLQDLDVWLERVSGAKAKGQGLIELAIDANGAKARVELREFEAKGIALSKLVAQVVPSPGGLTLSEVVAERGEARLRSDAIQLDATGIPRGTLHVERLALRQSLAELLGAVPADGVASGKLDITRGDEGDPEVHADLELQQPAISGYRFDSGKLRGRVLFRGAAAHEVAIDALELIGKAARVSARGYAFPTGAIALDATGQLTLGAQTLEGQGKVSGTWASPETRLTLGSSGAGPLALTAHLRGKAITEGTLELRDADLSARMPALEHAGEPYGKASARIELSAGVIDDVRSFEGQGELGRLVVGYGERRFASSAPVPLVLRKGRIEINGLALAEAAVKDGARWQVSGAVDLDRGLDLTARAQLPLAELLRATPVVGAVEGTVDAQLALQGPLDALRVRGDAETRGAQLEIGPAKLPWREVDAVVVLERNELSFQRAHGKLGSGTLALSGSIELSGIKPREVALALELKRFEIEPEPRFEVALDADATLEWKRGDTLPVLGGRVALSRLHYGRHVQLPEAVIAIGKRKKGRNVPTLALDLYVEHTAPITIRNDFLDAELSIAAAEGGRKAIHVVGTDTQIGALGALSVVRGRALFRGATLTVRKGVIGLVSDDRVVPSLELAADAPAKRRPGGLIVFNAGGDPQKFGLTLRCEVKDGGRVPPPFACNYAGDAMTCGNFEALTALWACQP